MSSLCESPKNVKRTDPYKYEQYENIKERHYYGKYNPSGKKSEYADTEPFYLGKRDVEDNNKEKYKYENCDLKGKLKLKFAIKSLLIPSGH